MVWKLRILFSVHFVIVFSLMHGQTIPDLSKIRIDTVYFKESNSSKGSISNIRFSNMIQSGDREHLILDCPMYGNVYFADPKTLEYVLPQLKGMPATLSKFVPSNKITFHDEKKRLWFDLYWIIITDLNDNYISHTISPYYTYREVFYRDFFTANEFRVGKNVLFSSHPLKFYDSTEVGQKVSSLIPDKAVLAMVSLQNILETKTGDSIQITEFISTSACESKVVNERGNGGRHVAVNPAETKIWFSDGAMSNLISYDFVSRRYECIPLPDNPIKSIKDWRRSVIKEKTTSDYNTILVNETGQNEKTAGLIWQIQWQLVKEPDDLFLYFGIGSRNNELTSKLMASTTINLNESYNNMLNTKDFVVYQYLKLHPNIKVMWEIILPGDHGMLVSSVSENSIQFYKLIDKDKKTIPALITWKF